MRFLRCGPDALLVELEDATERRALEAGLRAHPVVGVVEHVPAARTVLLRLDAGAEATSVVRDVRALPLEGAVADEELGDPLEVPVRYDGEDLHDVADALGVSAREVVARHTGQVWRVEFCGFAPGFGYLLGETGGLDVARRRSPRPRIPQGAVALADQYSGIYPRPSPGGWRLIGTTSLRMWDEHRDPAALLVPGRQVRFVETRGGT